MAIKVLPEALAHEEEHRARFWQEARAAAQVSHVNACSLYDVAEDQQHLILVMEFVDGESLSHRIQQGPIPVKDAAQIVLGILSALEAFHRKGIIHRDLKPGNILLSANGPKVLDFGIAKYIRPRPVDTNAATLNSTTLPGQFVGTPRYASPEQFRAEPVDARSDIFSVGAILFEMLIGHPAFNGATFGEIAHSVLHVSPPAVMGSPALATMGRIVHTALARAPRDRYQSAEKMAEDVRETLLMEGIDAQARGANPPAPDGASFRLLRPSDEVEFLTHEVCRKYPAFLLRAWKT